MDAIWPVRLQQDWSKACSKGPGDEYCGDRMCQLNRELLLVTAVVGVGSGMGHIAALLVSCQTVFDWNWVLRGADRHMLWTVHIIAPSKLKTQLFGGLLGAQHVE